MSRYKSAQKSIYVPKNPEKWATGGRQIIARSRLEYRFFSYFDLNRTVINIASERILIPYFDPVKNKNRRYYVDLIVKYNDRNGDIKIKLIEIKMSGETVPPKKPKRVTKSYQQALATFATNQAKWKAADAYAKSRAWEFVILTEKHFF